MTVVSNEWRRRFEELEAFWVHDDNPKRPHALLTSGNHSNGFFNASKVIAHPRILARALYSAYCDKQIRLPIDSNIDVVVGIESRGFIFGATERTSPVCYFHFRITI